MATTITNTGQASGTISTSNNTLLAGLMLACLVLCPANAPAQNSISVAANMELDSSALLLPDGQNFGRAVNGGAYQTEALVTHGDYQFATWFRYDSNSEQSVIIARRSLVDPSDTGWHPIDTNRDFINGAGPTPNWDSHNVSSLGISGDGRIHLAYDHHVDNLRYLTTRGGGAGKANLSPTDWALAAAAPDPDTTFFVPGGERSSLDAGGSQITGLTYPRFANMPNGDLAFEYRTAGSGSGDTNIATYDQSNVTWSASHEVIDGTSNNAGSYFDAVDMTPSDSRNAYLNGIDVGANGTMHMTWTWREGSQGANHDIMYAYSDTGGDTWKNNAGTVVANKATNQRITLDTPGITVVPLDRTQSVMNQQGQTVDLDGGVHALMWHRRDDDPQYAYTPGDRFSSSDSAYYHYYRDPVSGTWPRRQLPTSEAVGSRPKIVHAANGDLFAIYTSKNYLVVAGATKNANYDDWSILYDGEDETDALGLDDNGIRLRFVSSPLLDQERLLEDGVLSIFLQETGTATSNPSGTALRVLEFNVAIPVEPQQPIIIAGWDTWDSPTAPSSTVTASGVTATATASTSSGNWSITDDGSDPGRGSSGDTTWGTFDGAGIAASAVTDDGTANFTVTNARPSAEVTITLTNNSGADLELGAFHMDVVAFRPKAARTYAFNVLSGDITTGNVFTSDAPLNDNSTNAVTHLGGTLTGHDQHDDIDLDLTGLADHTLAVGESAVFQIAFSAGVGDNAGGHHLFLDNVAFSGTTEAAPVLLGDVSLDGVVDFLDIAPFITVLSGGTFQAEADCDESGVVDFLDIGPFIAILSGT